MKRKIPWIDMIYFYLLLPVLSVMVGRTCHKIYLKEGKIGFLCIGLLFYGFAWFLLHSSIGVFVTKLMGKMEKAIGDAFRETWDWMVDLTIEARSSR